ncbi:hypothetical protein [Corallococcus sp. CA053C]|uniref:hypothetical protein n=1 Tax=Corallococcus sp. CA053C TaxID=2316732 RepID=UPI0011C44C3A|nr:hypothetical protein [Corallococcus sp. CA053C]
MGMLLARSGPGGVTLEEVRPAKDNPTVSPAVTLTLLWRAELLALVEEAGAVRGLRSASKARLVARLLEVLPGDTLRSRVREAVCARSEWRADVNV